MPPDCEHLAGEFDTNQNTDGAMLVQCPDAGTTADGERDPIDALEIFEVQLLLFLLLV